MKLSTAPSNAVKRFRTSPFRFQKTFKAPLKRLPSFLNAIVSTSKAQTATVTIQEVVFEPKHWIAFLTRYSLSPRYGKGVSVTAEGQHEILEMLEATFADWIDFLFAPTPKPFVVYADHDEYVTFYANTRSNLNRIAEVLAADGFEEIADFKRQL